jgi:hypothetical protein
MPASAFAAPMFSSRSCRSRYRAQNSLLAATEVHLGVSISLLFVRGPSIQETLNELVLEMTAEHRNGPLVQRGTISMVNLPSGFHMIWSNTCDERRFMKATLAKLSNNGEVVLQSLEEHVMFSHIEYWRGGAQEWCVSHAGDLDDKDLKSKGHPPDLFNALRHEQMSRGDDGDFFDIPVQMGDQLTGYRYDREYEWMNESAPTKRRYWKFW